MSNTITRDHLRPVERRVLDLQDEGLTLDEIAARFNRSPEFVGRMIDWTRIPRSGPPTRDHLSPMQRRVLDMRAAGESHDEIAAKFRKGEAFIRQVEGLAYFKESLRLLTRPESVEPGSRVPPSPASPALPPTSVAELPPGGRNE